MCINCYNEFGAPTITTIQVVECSRLIRKVYEFSSVGGNAHIAFDDWNIDDEDILWCLGTGLSDNIHNAGEEQLKAEREALEAFLMLGMNERASALAINDGFLFI